MPPARLIVRKIHKWLGLLLGLQVLLWLSGGVVMSLLPIELVRGEHWIGREDPPPLRAADFRVPLAEIAPQGAAFARASTTLRLGAPVYVLRDQHHGTRIVHAGTGQELAPLTDTEAADLARARHRDQPPVHAVHRIDAPSGEARGLEAPVLRVELADRWHTHVYVDPVSARIVAVRNDLWRVYDFFWMLHIMDYAGRDDFNNNLLRAAAGSSWFFGLSGVCLLWYSFGRRLSGRKASRPEAHRSNQQ